MTATASRRTLAQFLALATVWGASFLFIKVGLEGLAPGQVVLGRLGSGALALAGVSLAGRRPLPRDPRAYPPLFVLALLLCVVPFLLFAWAETRIGSGLASIYNATTPLMTMLVALAALPSERPTRARLAGLLLGFAGVVVVLGPWRGLGGGEALGQLACLGATACYGMALVVLRRFVAPLGLPAVTVATVQVGLGALVMLALTPFVAAGPVRLDAALDPKVVGAVLALGVLGTGLAYVWNTNVVGSWGATNASTVTYLTPIVGVGLGVVVLGEGVTWNQPLGALVVLVGIAVSQDRLAPLALLVARLLTKRGTGRTSSSEPVVSG